jgi:hypothetical protein
MWCQASLNGTQTTCTKSPGLLLWAGQPPFATRVSRRSGDCEAIRTVTSFDTSRHHIYIDFTITDGSGNPFELSGVIDTGAPWTEFNDAFLAHAGFLNPPDGEIPIKPELETQKYARLLLPSIAICGHTINDFEVMVSRFDPAWGIAALIGLDFFKRFKVTIDYSRGVLVCEPLEVG